LYLDQDTATGCFRSSSHFNFDLTVSDLKVETHTGFPFAVYDTNAVSHFFFRGTSKTSFLIVSKSWWRRAACVCLHFYLFYLLVHCTLHG